MPDRYVKGTCPKCKAIEQYGDVCEKCSNTHKTTDLIDPKCSLCGNTPVEKQSEHYFFKLSAFDQKRKHFFQTAELQPEIVNFVSNWLPELQDWCISRDGPYFGFKIPGEENKYYYVWLDAPIGYIAATEHYCKKTKEVAEMKESVADYWNNSETKIVHFIGKDIVYFHFLFWPAMLIVSGFQLPSKIMVHGFLTVNKEKMSKSRGTFITARQYLEHLNPELLRFYYAVHLSPTLTDLDLDLSHFKERVNNELIGNIANFCYRVLYFAEKQFKGRISHYNENTVSDELVELQRLFVSIQTNYEKINFKDALKDILAVCSIGNKYFQKNEPWKLVKEDPKKAEEVISFCTMIIQNLSIMIAPVLPSFSVGLQKQLGVHLLQWNDISFAQKQFSVSGIIPLIKKLENEHEKLIVQPIQSEQMQNKQEKINVGGSESPPSELPLLLKVGKILSVDDHPQADKLYLEKIDLGNGDIRTIVSGIKQWYKKEALVGKHAIVVANLKYRKFRGVISEGMILTAEHDGKLQILEAKKSVPGESVFFDEWQKTPEQIHYDDFAKLKLIVQHKKVLCFGKKLKTEHAEITVDMPDGAKVA